MWQRIKSIVVKEFIHLARDYWFTIFIILGPATELFAFDFSWPIIKKGAYEYVWPERGYSI